MRGPGGGVAAVRLETLAFGAFGPFAHDVSIDFGALGAEGLFLVEGPTGSGKSTIIDAITFALYGKTAGERSAGRPSHARVTSDWAAPASTPFAELIFATKRGTRYRVRRSPRHERPKRRGDGTTVIPPTAHVWQLGDAPNGSDAEGSPARLVASQTRDVDAEIERLIGLSYDQFTQVVVLPQGEFARFLHATPDERAQLLRPLFGTEIFDRIATELEKRSAQARAEEDEKRETLDRAVAGFTEAARLPDAHSQALRKNEGGTIGVLVAEACAEIAAQVDVTLALERQARVAEAAAKDRLDRVRSLVEACDRRDRALTEIRALDNDAERHADVVQERDALRQARALLPSHLGLLAARRRARESATNWREKASAAKLNPDVGPDAVDGALADATESVVRLEQLAEVESERDRHQVELTADKERETTLVAAIQELERQLDSNSGSARTLERRLAEIAPNLGNIDRATAERELAGRQAEAARRLVDARARLGAVEAVARTQETTAREAGQAAERLRLAYLDDIAGQLAVDLAAGAACPVCGSIEHPEPAPPPASPVSRAECAAADQRAKDALNALDDGHASVKDARGDVSKLAIACGDIDPATAEERVALAQAALAAANSARDHHAAVEAELRNARAERAAIEESLATSRDSLAACAERIRGTAERVGILEAKLRPHCGERGSVADHFAAAATRRNALSSARSACQANARARDSLAQASAQFQALLVSARIADESEFARLADRLAALPRLEDEVSELDRRRVEAEAILREDDVVAARSAVRPDQEAAEKTAAEAEFHHERAVAARDAWVERSAAAERSATKVKTTWSDLAAAEERAGPVSRLADIVAGRGGGNRPRLPLATYVLVTRFRRVVAAANERLSGMLDGHFLLEEHQDQEGRARYAGLGLRVRDMNTETERDVRTLSGGETFGVSLALALGLADVVVAEAGGRALGTLFIDEGFGSLDAGALDDVMAEVSQLRRADRVVGIVSHVEDLKQRIPNRVEVRRGEAGSNTIRVIPQP